MFISFAEAKRILDIIIALCMVLAFLPIWIVIPILILLDSPGPIIFTHKRVGKNGRPIRLYKFRSMVKDADEILHKKDPKLLAEFKKNDWKLEHDPRITRLGKILRSLTIDEFPQLLNVLKGEMSIVGPRAYVAKELEEQQQKYPEARQLIPLVLSIKPGLTGPWQVAGRNEIPFIERIRMDAAYAKKKNLLDDFIILLKTPKAMLSKW